MTGGVAGTAAYYEYYAWATLWGVVTAVFAYYLWMIRKRIRFVGFLMNAGVLILARFPSTIVVAYGALFLQALWVIFWDSRGLLGSS